MVLPFPEIYPEGGAGFQGKGKEALETEVCPDEEAKGRSQVLRSSANKWYLDHGIESLEPRTKPWLIKQKTKSQQRRFCEWPPCKREENQEAVTGEANTRIEPVEGGVVPEPQTAR